MLGGGPECCRWLVRPRFRASGAAGLLAGVISTLFLVSLWATPSVLPWLHQTVQAADTTGAATFSPPPRLPASLPSALHYVAHWNLLPVGEATLSWSERGGQRQVRFSADSNRLVSLFYPVRDQMASTYAMQSFCTQSVDNHTVEGRRQRETHIRYEPVQHRLVLDEIDDSREPPVAKHEMKPIPGCVVDLFTALDYARGQRLQLGDEYAFPVNEGGATARVQLKVDLKETVNTPAGAFTAVRAVPTVVGETSLHPIHPGKLWIWFSDDARHIPVQIKAQVSWGTILAQLASY